MDCEFTSLDFALLGHQDSWQRVEVFVKGIRDPELESLPVDKIRDIFPWIPPRVAFHIKARSAFDGKTVWGAYIETFISPDKLHPGALPGQKHRVLEAAERACDLGAHIVGLGGFTSIILEGQTSMMANCHNTVFTTGNTLTAVYIVKGLEEACRLRQISIPDSNLLIIGASGDIGSACARYFQGKCRHLLLHARRPAPLETIMNELKAGGQACTADTGLESLAHQADIIIATASTADATFDPSVFKPGVIICDAGYPKNFLSCLPAATASLFYGGMGQMLGGFEFVPVVSGAFYKYPAANIGHGCMFEAMLLAMEGWQEPYSSGRGYITPEKMQKIWEIALKHGMPVAPLFNRHGCWSFD